MVKTQKDIIKECLLQYHNEVIRPKLAEIEASIADSLKLSKQINDFKKALTANESTDNILSSKINIIQKENTRQDIDVAKLGKKLTEAENQIKTVNNNIPILNALKTALNELKTSDEKILKRIKSVEEIQEYYYNKLDRVVDILNMELDKIYSSISTVLPEIPTEDGNYILKLTITEGIPTYNWIKE